MPDHWHKIEPYAGHEPPVAVNCTECGKPVCMDPNGPDCFCLLERNHVEDHGNRWFNARWGERCMPDRAPMISSSGFRGVL